MLRHCFKNSLSKHLVLFILRYLQAIWKYLNTKNCPICGIVCAVLLLLLKALAACHVFFLLLLFSCPMQGSLAGKGRDVGDRDGPQPHPADQGQVVLPGLWEGESGRCILELLRCLHRHIFDLFNGWSLKSRTEKWNEADYFILFLFRFFSLRPYCISP